jgi:FkbM family methyltransferase
MSPSYLRKSATSIFDSIAAMVPEFAQPVFGAIESLAARARGRGFGSCSISDEIRAVIELLPASGAVVVDAGANVGAWSAELLSVAASRVARLIAVEPSAVHRETLSRMLSYPHEYLAVALGGTARSQVMYSDSPGSGLSSLYQRDLSHLGLRHEESETVITRTLDDVMREREIAAIDLLKMDVEGGELEILRGATAALHGRRIRALTFEFGGCNVDSRTYFKDYWSLLSPLGYSLFRVIPGGRLLAIATYSERDEFFITTNYVAVLGGK